MKGFFDDTVLLKNGTAERLYSEHAKSMPILDYHCHLDPKEIAEDRRYRDLTELWLGGDHYKWRAMRQNGVPEEFITGNAPAKEKFIRFAETLEKAPGNPLYYWAHMELKALFGITRPLNAASAAGIFDEAGEIIRSGGFSAQSLIRAFNVEVICTTDDPADDLQWHEKIRRDHLTFKVLPTFRPDVACFGLNRPDFTGYLQRLGKAENAEIKDFSGFLEVLKKRFAFFLAAGCRVADHALNTVPSEKGSFEDAEGAFRKAFAGETVSQAELDRYTDFMTRFFARLYAENDVAMQLHVAPLRNVNPALFAALGPDSGIDVIGDAPKPSDLARLLADIRREGDLPKTVFYSLNATATDAISSLTGAFSEGFPGKMQLGSAWWFNDHLEGIRRQLHSLANAGLLGLFIGMLTDSRSFTSYVRFDFFRRILCSEFGEWIENGEFDPDAGALIEEVCYGNAKRYFGF